MRLLTKSIGIILLCGIIASCSNHQANESPTSFQSSQTQTIQETKPPEDNRGLFDGISWGTSYEELKDKYELVYPKTSDKDFCNVNISHFDGTVDYEAQGSLYFDDNGFCKGYFNVFPINSSDSSVENYQKTTMSYLKSFYADKFGETGKESSDGTIQWNLPKGTVTIKNELFISVEYKK